MVYRSPNIYSIFNNYLFIEDFQHLGLELEAREILMNQTNLVPAPVSFILHRRQTVNKGVMPSMPVGSNQTQVL